MTKEIAKANNKPFFSLREGSNYKVMMTYDRSEVVEFEQFKKLMQQLNDTEIKFLTINQQVVNKSTILGISPTDEKTEKQKEEIRNNPKVVLIEDEDGNPVPLNPISSGVQVERNQERLLNKQKKGLYKS
jgi:hypothetical protein